MMSDINRLTATLGLLLLAGLVRANSAVGVDTGNGNALNPDGEWAHRTVDPRGLSSFKQAPSRTPGGLLYEHPPVPRDFKSLTDGLDYYGHIELGLLTDDGKERSAQFREFSDWDTGVLLNSFNVGLLHRETGHFAELAGIGVGRDDQYYALEAGRHGRFRLSGFFNETPHVFATNAVSFFDGIGTDHLVLPAALTPGNNSLAALSAAIETAGRHIIDLSREKGGFSLRLTPLDRLQLHAGYTQESRNGTRPFGGGFSAVFYGAGDIGGVVETAEPIDYVTHDFSGGLNLATLRYQLNLNYAASLFRNDKRYLTWENPFQNFPTDAVLIERGRFALYPDNDYHHVKIDGAHTLPLNGRITASLSWTKMSQDEALLPPTINSGVSVTGIDLDDWNTAAALKQRKADAEISTWRYQLGVQLTPWKRLSLRARLRYSDEDNDTRYTAFNPVTGETGYIIEDGSHFFRGETGVFEPGVPGSRFHYRSIPFAQQELQLDLGFDYRIAKKTTLTVSYEREEIERDHRERDETDEDRWSVRLSNRSLPWATLRLSYEYADRGGSAYDYNPYEPFYTSSLPGYASDSANGSRPHTLADLRKFDLSDRKQHLFKGRVNFLIRDDMDVVVSGQWSDEDYKSDFGLRDGETKSVNAEWSWQPSMRGGMYAYYSFHRNETHMANANDLRIGTDPAAGGDVFPASAFWSEFSAGRSHVLGLGVNYAWDRVALSSDYAYVYSRDEFDYRFTSEDAYEDRNIRAADAGDGFPDLKYGEQVATTELTWTVNRKLDLRFYHRYEWSKTRNWHFEGLQPLIGRNLFLAAVPEDYTVNLLGVFLRYRL